MIGNSPETQPPKVKGQWPATVVKYAFGLALAVLLLWMCAPSALAAIGNRLLIEGQVDWYALTPDGREVVVLARGVTSHETASIYRVHVDGSAPPQRLSGELYVDRVFGLSPDGRTVVFQSTSEDPPNPLYSVRVRGGSPIHLGTSFQDSTWVTDAHFTLDNEAVVVRTTLGNWDGGTGLYRVPLAGGDAVQLVSKPGVAAFYLSPDGSHFVYLLIADQVPTQTRYVLYSMPITGGPEVELHRTAQPYSTIANIDFGLDGSAVLYLADETVNNLYELYQIPIAGGTPVNLSRPAFFQQPQADLFAVTPDDTTVIFQTNRTLEHPYELYSVPHTNGVPVPLAPITASQSIVQSMRWKCAISADGQWLTYSAIEGDWVSVYGGVRGADLYRVAVKGGDAVQLNRIY